MSQQEWADFLGNGPKRKRPRQARAKRRASPVSSPPPRRPAGMKPTLTRYEVSELLKRRKAAIEREGPRLVHARPADPRRQWRTSARPGPITVRHVVTEDADTDHASGDTEQQRI